MKSDAKTSMIRVSEQTHRLLKGLAGLNGLTMSEMLEKMKNSNINFEHIETDGHLILKINESDKDRVHDIIDVPALKPKI